MPKSQLIAITIALSAGLLFATTEIVSAQATTMKGQKLTFEEAYTTCRTGFMKGTGSAAGTHAGGNYARGSACMKQYGYRLKRSQWQ